MKFMDVNRYDCNPENNIITVTEFLQMVGYYEQNSFTE